MKFLCYILVILTVWLSTMPCCAEDECCSETEMTSSENSNGPLHSDESTTHCSPLMVCGSCAGYVLLSFQPNLNPENEVTGDLKISYTQQYANHYNQEIWQPPRKCN